jgi:hypothetical protein
MQRNVLILLTFVPVLTGYLLNRLILVPGLGTLLFYLMPCVTLLFWFFLGTRYAKSDWNFIQSTVIGNGVGILSLGLYFWQFLLCGDDSRNIFLAGFSQDFTSNTNLFTARLAMLFEAEKNTISQTSTTAMQVLGLLFMIIIFMLGYGFGMRKNISETRGVHGS